MTAIVERAHLRPGDLVHRVSIEDGMRERQTGQVVFSGMCGCAEWSLVVLSDGRGLQWGEDWLRHGHFVMVMP
jgi:hypothetical protein